MFRPTWCHQVSPTIESLLDGG